MYIMLMNLTWTHADSEESVERETVDVEKQFNFVTHLFFLTHKCLILGELETLLPLYNKLLCRTEYTPLCVCVCVCVRVCMRVCVICGGGVS